YTNVNYKGKDIKELSDFTENVVKPYLERQDGVASVTANGLINDSIEVKLSSKKIDKINAKILAKTNDKLAEASDKIEESRAKLAESKSEIESSKQKLNDTQSKTTDQLSAAATQLSKAQSTKSAYESTLLSLNASKSALESERKAYTDAKLEEAYEGLDKALAALNQSVGMIAGTQGIVVPSSVEEAVNAPESYEKFINWMTDAGYGDQVKDLSLSTLQQVYSAVKVRLPQIDTELANLNTEIKAQEAIVSQLDKKISGLDDKQSHTNSAGLNAAVEFGSGKSQLASAETQISNAEKELDTAEENLEKSVKAARENSNIDALLSIDTLSQLISAQSFSMPAGYVEDKDSNQWLIEVNENFTSEKQLKNLVLTKISGIVKIKLSDVADIVTVDNIGEAYCKVNGEDAVMLSIYKANTANTSEVSNGINDALKELEAKYDGLSFTQMMNQGDYITRIIDSVLSSSLLGAILAIIVLALFLKSVKPTVVVAFSIPFSVLFALIIMYFTGINLNVMSLAGLCISIGMLVDNSVVVMENIFRMRQKGIPAPRAAVQGTKQVAAPIVASTLTTICVFLPMVYTTGIVAQLLIPFAFTISYALIASLIVALTVVPTIGSLILKNTKQRKQNWFDKLKNLYARALAFCLRFKFVPLVVSVVLLGLMIVQTFNTGMATIDS
ncbi:MAG: efflux RND transporter permease subunit, partial [Ruminococcus sp.]|nr:efflux RND transporter permease subunit [Ruminococcus sp.]